MAEYQLFTVISFAAATRFRTAPQQEIICTKAYDSSVWLIRVEMKTHITRLSREVHRFRNDDSDANILDGDDGGVDAKRSDLGLARLPRAPRATRGCRAGNGKSSSVRNEE